MDITMEDLLTRPSFLRRCSLTKSTLSCLAHWLSVCVLQLFVAMTDGVELTKSKFVGIDKIKVVWPLMCFVFRCVLYKSVVLALGPYSECVDPVHCLNTHFVLREVEAN